MGWFSITATFWNLCLLSAQLVDVLGLDCGYSGAPAFGRPHPVREIYKSDEGVSFTCAPGYTLQGPPQRICLSNGTWAGNLPLCDRSLSSLEQQATSRATLKLYPAEKSIDGDPGTCTYTDKVKPRWIRVDLRSNQRVRAVSISVPKGIYTQDAAQLTIYVISVEDSTRASYHKCASFNGIFSTETLKLSCSGGELEGRYIHINDDRHRVDYFSFCEINVYANRGSYDCGEAERPAHSYSIRTEAGSVTYRCVFGYRLEGPSTRYCLPDGTWSLSQPICREVVCPVLDDVEYGRIQYIGPKRGRPTQGTVANVSCDYGYRASGSPLHCEESGYWSRGNLSCQPVDCGMPTVRHVVEQYVLLNGTNYGSVLILRCGNQETYRTCREDGKWSSIDLDCTENGMLATLGLVDEEPSDVPMGIVVGMAIIVFILLLLVIFVLFVKRRNILRRNSTDSLPSKETGSSLAPAMPQPYENDSFYASIPVESANDVISDNKKNYMSTILFTRKKSPKKEVKKSRTNSLESAAGSCIYEEIGISQSQLQTSRVTELKVPELVEEDCSQPVYAQVDMDEKRKSRLLKSLCNRFDPVDPPEWEKTYRSEKDPSFDDVDLEPIKLRELPPVPQPEESENEVTYASLAFPLEPPSYMRNNEIYEESVPSSDMSISVMKDNDLYLSNTTK